MFCRRRDRAAARSASRCNRGRQESAQVRQARPAPLRTRARRMLGNLEAEHSAVQQLRLAVRLIPPLHASWPMRTRALFFVFEKPRYRRFVRLACTSRLTNKGNPVFVHK